MGILLTSLGVYESGIFDDGAAEIVAHDQVSQRLFVINAGASTMDILDISNPGSPTLVTQVVVLNPNSVAVKNGLIAVASASDSGDCAGQVVFFNANGDNLGFVTVGCCRTHLPFRRTVKPSWSPTRAKTSRTLTACASIRKARSASSTCQAASPLQQ